MGAQPYFFAHNLPAQISKMATPETLTNTARLNQLHAEKEGEWLFYMSDVIDAVCDEQVFEDNEYGAVAQKYDLSLGDFACLLIESTVANEWLPLIGLIELAQEIEHIEGGLYLDVLNEALMGKYTTEMLQFAFEQIPCVQTREEYLNAFNVYFGDGELTL